MYQIGVQSKNVITDENPLEGFQLLKKTGFSCADFSLNSYLLNTELYEGNCNGFFDKTEEELKAYFLPHKQAAKETGIVINQMHMPYPIFIPNGSQKINNYLWNEVAPKSMMLCQFFECKNIVIHAFKLANFLGSEEAEWAKTEEFIHTLAPMAKEMGITICIENLYGSTGGHIIEGPCCNARKAAERIDRINQQYGAEVLGFCLDTGHANLIGLDFYDFIVTLGSRLKVLHIHDNDGIGDLHQIPFTFTKIRENTASTDWNGFIKGLKEIGYDKVLSFETAPVLTSFPDEIKLDVLNFINKIGIYFMNQINRA